MKKGLAALLFLAPVFVFAQSPDPNACLQQMQAQFTCYAPGLDPNMEGPFETSRVGTNGQNIPATLDDVRLGRSKTVTLAGNPAHYGKYYNLGTIVYTSAIDGATYTMRNVVGYVHDTGCAFKAPGESGSCCSRYNTCAEVPRKLDIAHGDYRDRYTRGGVTDVNHGPSCAKINRTICQIAGPLTTPPDVTSQGVQPGNDQLMSLGNFRTGTGQTTGVNASPGITASPYTGGSGASSQTGTVSSRGSSQNYGSNSTGSYQQSSYTTGGSVPTNPSVPISPIGFLFKRFASVALGGMEWISWGVIGSADNCSVSVTSPTNTVTLGQGKSGTQMFGIPQDATKGTWTISLSCRGFSKSDSFTVI
ncbi:hypothetical protein EBR66_04470 [bacterium]|nr:hypothetical protein [bacterium]